MTANTSEQAQKLLDLSIGLLTDKYVDWRTQRLQEQPLDIAIASETLALLQG